MSGKESVMLRTVLLALALSAGVLPVSAQAFATVADQPTWSLEQAGGVPFARISSLALSDSLLAVGDAGNKMVHILTTRGAHVNSLGREGEGPGEFMAIGSVFAAADGGFWVSDLWPSTRRLTPISETGSMLESTRLTNQVSDVIGVLPDGQFLGSTSPADLVDAVGLVEYRRIFQAFHLGHGLTPLVEVGGVQIYLDQMPNGMIRQLELPFLAEVSVAVHPDGFATANSREGTVRLFSPEGEMSLELDLQAEAEQATEDDWGEYVAAYVSRLPESMQPGFRRSLRDVELPDTWPVVGAVLTDQQGRIWVKRWTLLHTAREDWQVFSSSGEFLGWVRFPAAFTPHVVTEDSVVGVRRDEYDVEHVQSWAIFR